MFKNLKFLCKREHKILTKKDNSCFNTHTYFSRDKTNLDDVEQSNTLTEESLYSFEWKTLIGKENQS